MTAGAAPAPAAGPSHADADRAPADRGAADGARRATDGANASPVAAAIAAAAGRRPRPRRRHRARRADHQGRRARRGGQRRRAAATAGRPAPQPAGAQLIKGGAAVLARYMDESRSIPTATSFRTLTVTVLDAAPQAAQGRRPPRLLHPPDRLRDRARGHRRHAGDGPPLRRDRRQAAPRRRRRRQPRPGRRRREEGRHRAR